MTKIRMTKRRLAERKGKTAIHGTGQAVIIVQKIVKKKGV